MSEELTAEELGYINFMKSKGYEVCKNKDGTPFLIDFSVNHKHAIEYAKAKTEKKQKVLNECASMLSEYMQKNTVLHDEVEQLQKEVEYWEKERNELNEMMSERIDKLKAENEALKEGIKNAIISLDNGYKKVAIYCLKELIKTKAQ